MSTHREFWGDYYRAVFESGQTWLDYSNERVQAQTFGLVLEAAGPLTGRRCLDIGCGWGQLARALHDFGAADVTAVDIVPEVIGQLAAEFPHIRWLAGNLAHDELGLTAEATDVLLLVEVLQYLPLERTLAIAWELLASGGRLVAVVPNADCPIVKATRARFDDRYEPVGVDGLRHAILGLTHVERWACRGLSFAHDQAIHPYEVTPWTQSAKWATAPNRLQVVVVKQK
jgi:2-polyprenyl-3-methyl-5-hydroxy-6-metoxy-1,4-benzoquinol methylase